MEDVNHEARSGEQADQKPKFKTNKVNVMFRQTASETEPTKERDSASPGPAATKPATKSSLALSHGRFTLAAIREPNSSSSPSPSPAPQAWHRPGEGAATATAIHTASTAGAAPPVSGTTDVPLTGADESSSSSHLSRSVELNEEELTAKGISLAGRFHSASDMHWEDEEDDWVPPPHHGGDVTKADAKKTMSPPSLAPADAPSDSSPWSAAVKRTVPPAARPLTETIKEMKLQKDQQRRTPSSAPVSRIPPRPVFGSANVPPGTDGLSRFRINRNEARPPMGGALPAGRGPPPLNPRDLSEGSHRPSLSANRFDAEPDEADFSMFAKRKPLATPHDPRATAAPHTTVPSPAAIPEQLRMKTAPTSAATAPAATASPTITSTTPAPTTPAPTASASDASSEGHQTAGATQAAPAGASPGKAVDEPGPAASRPAAAAPKATEASNTNATETISTAASAGVASSDPAKISTFDPQAPTKSLLEQQKEEMRAVLMAAKAKRDAEAQAEREKQERLARKREELRREIEEKQVREREERERVRKERQARLEERSRQLKIQREEREQQEREQHRERQEKAQREREAERSRDAERSRATERSHGSERHSDRQRDDSSVVAAAEPQHPVHTAGDWAAAKKKAGGPVFQSAWNGKQNGTSVKPADARDARDAQGESRELRFKDVRKLDAGARTQGVHSGSQAGFSAPSGPVRGSSLLDLPVPVSPVVRPKAASFAEEQHASHLRRLVRVKLPKIEGVGGFDVKDVMYLDAPGASSEFVSTASVESRGKRQFREPLADRRPANVRMPGDVTPKSKNAKPRGQVRQRSQPKQNVQS